MDIFDLGAESLDRVLKPKDAKAPSLRILEVNGDYQLGFVVYDGIAINTMANGPLEALLVLMAVYYTFDLEYPGVYIWNQLWAIYRANNNIYKYIIQFCKTNFMFDGMISIGI